MNKRKLSNIYRIGFQRLLFEGLRVTIIPTYSCNFNCSYCSKDVFGDTPVAPRKSLEDWQKYLTDLDTTFRNDGSKIKEIILNGGEPTLLPYFINMCNWITERWLLTIYTNLWNIDKLSMVRPTTRLIVHATFHCDQITHTDFNRNWRELDKIHRVTVDEIGRKRLVNPYKRTRLKPFTTQEKLDNHLATIRIDPQLRMHLTCGTETKANLPPCKNY